MAPATIAVHPAGRWTGIVRRTSNDLAGWRLLDRGDDPAAYLARVLPALAELHQPGDRVALVTLPPPAATIGHGTSYAVVCRALVLGALLGNPAMLGGSALLVRPAGYGRWLLGGYPAELVGTRERRGGGRLRACRAAWDVAGAATPDRPPTLDADRALARERLQVTHHADRFGDYAGWVRAGCGLCGGGISEAVPADADPAAYAAEAADRHVDRDLRAAGRAGCLLLPTTTDHEEGATDG